MTAFSPIGVIDYFYDFQGKEGSGNGTMKKREKRNCTCDRICFSFLKFIIKLHLSLVQLKHQTVDKHYTDYIVPHGTYSRILRLKNSKIRVCFKSQFLQAMNTF